MTYNYFDISYDIRLMSWKLYRFYIVKSSFDNLNMNGVEKHNFLILMDSETY